MERMTVQVLLTIGDQAELITPERDHTNPERVPVARIAQDTGIPAEQLPGRKLIAVVDNGELVRFESV